MKEYKVRRRDQCPTGLHLEPGTDLTVDCDCPWLTVAEQHPVPHQMRWNRRELETLIREFDRGYFDPDGYPPRKDSLFLSPYLARVIELAEAGNPLHAALTLISMCSLSGLAWDEQERTLSLRLFPGRWACLQMPEREGGPVGFREHPEPFGADPRMLWMPLSTVDGEVVDQDTDARLREQLRALTGVQPASLAMEAWEPADRDADLAITVDGDVSPASADDLAAAVQALEDEARKSVPDFTITSEVIPGPPKKAVTRKARKKKTT